MLDEHFVTHARDCGTSRDLLIAFDAHLAHLAVLPHVKLPHTKKKGAAPAASAPDARGARELGTAAADTTDMAPELANIAGNAPGASAPRMAAAVGLAPCPTGGGRCSTAPSGAPSSAKRQSLMSRSGLLRPSGPAPGPAPHATIVHEGPAAIAHESRCGGNEGREGGGGGGGGKAGEGGEGGGSSTSGVGEEDTSASGALTGGGGGAGAPGGAPGGAPSPGKPGSPGGASESDETDTMNMLIEDKIRSGKGMRRRSGEDPGERASGVRLALGGLQQRPSFDSAFQEAVQAAAMSPMRSGGSPAAAGRDAGDAGDASTSFEARPRPTSAGPAPAPAAASGISFFGFNFTPLQSPKVIPAPAPSALARRRRLFIELVQLNPSGAAGGGGSEWVRTHHWNWAFGQEIGRDGLWSRPHLPTISARAMVHLLEGLDDSNVFMDLPGATLAEVAANLSSGLVENRVLDPALQQRLVETLRSREALREPEAAATAHAPAGRSPPAVSAGAPPLSSTGGDGLRLAAPRDIPPPMLGLSQTFNPCGRSDTRQPNHSVHSASGKPPPPAALHQRPPADQPPSTRRAHLDLSPDAEEEAFEMLVAHVEYVARPLMAFVRLATAIQTGIAKATPVRFLFVLLAPASAPADSEAMATAFGSIMLDEDFAAAVCSCASTATFHELLLRELDCVTIVPSSHIPHAGSHPRHGSSSAPAVAAAASSTNPQPTVPPRPAQVPARADGERPARRASVLQAALNNARRSSAIIQAARMLKRTSTRANLHLGRGEQMRALERRKREAKKLKRAMQQQAPTTPPPKAEEAHLAVAGGGSLPLGSPPRAQAQKQGQTLRSTTSPPSPTIDSRLSSTWQAGDGRRRSSLLVAATMPVSPDLFGLDATPARKRASIDSSSPSVLMTPAREPAHRLPAGHRRLLRRLMNLIHGCQAYSVPLLLGILCSLIWANVDYASYNYVVNRWEPFPGVALFGHTLTVKFVVNDIFMVFFFGLAAKEVTEACLPGGSLNPPRKALAPLVGTVAGVCGPIATYLLLLYVQFYGIGAFSDGYDSMEAANARAWLAADAAGLNASSLGGSGSGSGGGSGSGSSAAAPVDYSGYDFTSPEASLGFAELARGWGVPTATDISLAWMVAVQVFPLRHPAIEFLLLLAVADDAIGLAIIAIAYGDGKSKPEWLLLVLAGFGIALLMRSPLLRVRQWYAYVIFGGLPSWIGLVQAALHPALALVVIVPVMPPVLSPRIPLHALWAALVERCTRHSVDPGKLNDEESATAGAADAADASAAAAHEGPHAHDPHAPLHAFERQIKIYIDFGLFFFTLANAGVQMDNIGPLTFTIFGALVIGKVITITFVVLLGTRSPRASHPPSLPPSLLPSVRPSLCLSLLPSPLPPSVPPSVRPSLPPSVPPSVFPSFHPFPLLPFPTLCHAH